ncbi:CIC11C00000004119 [Sungouiella intermedia]|uniref:diacylglycerol cholinephosphotransferase n=1 Tax=Sungouiella intermedia TaxID=45354 RepID=A0A1L0BA42_9ASCO|nr:CIC11C00000004119 [[Candida] intermedia]SGZ50751.1 CIC11C00000003708 [[Candida] intermedia]
MGLYIPTNKLENLKLYKYSSEDHSLISRYILKRWWNYFVKIFPLDMAPNVITLLGLFFIIANLLCVFYYDPWLDSPSPRWCYFFYAFGFFMYQTFDGCDGCHARRTQQSGPLGELFDHSIDAINTTLGTIVVASTFQLGYGWMLLLGIFASTCNFYTSTWEEYHTHTLYLSQFSGPVEGILIICLVFIVTGLFGPDIWQWTLFDLDLTSLGHGFGVVSISTGNASTLAGVAQLYFNVASAVGNVAKKYKSDKKLLSLAVKTEIRDAKKGLIPFFAYFASVFAFVLIYPQALYKYAFPLVISVGMTIAFCVGRIILAHLTLQEFPFVQPPAFLPLLQITLAKFLITLYGYDEASTLCGILWTGAGLTIGIHASFVVDIISDITQFLDIYALSIKHKKV